MTDVDIRVQERLCEERLCVGVAFSLVQGSVVPFLMGVGCRLEDQGISVQWVSGIKKPSCE